MLILLMSASIWIFDLNEMQLDAESCLKIRGRVHHGRKSLDGCGRGARTKGELTPWCTRARAREGCEVRIRSYKKRCINKFSTFENREKYIPDPTSAKRNPPENRGPSLKFRRCFVRYRLAYEQIRSIQMGVYLCARNSSAHRTSVEGQIKHCLGCE
jgi:hypothetical protein